MAGYLARFGFQSAPFSTAPDPRFAFATRAHEIELLRMQDSVEQRLGLCLLVGDIGAGKSTIAHLLLSAWAKTPDQYAVAYISDPSPQTPAQFLRLLVSSFGLTPSRYQETNKDTLRGFLLDCYAEGKTVVAMLDEAQTIHASNMAVIQHLSNEQTSDTKLMQIALIAQPNIARKLLYFPALNSRIARRGTLNPLIYEDTEDMMRYRVRVAGVKDFAALFPPDTVRAIYNATEGNPRRICILADNALFAAFTQHASVVTVEAVDAAIKQMSYGEQK